MFEKPVRKFFCEHDKPYRERNMHHRENVPRLIERRRNINAPGNRSIYQYELRNALDEYETFKIN